MSDFKRIGDFAKVRRGASPRPIDDPKWFGGDIGWVRIVDVTRSKRYLRSTEQYLSPLGEARSVRVDKGDLIMSICATIGRPVIVDMAACIHDGFVQFYDITDADTEYLYYALQHAEAEFLGYGQHGTQANLNTTIVGRHNLFVPPLPQQRKIARILTKVDNLIEKTEALIAKYQAIKQGMMHDLFTRGVDEHGHLRPPYEQAPELYKQSELGWIPRDWEVDVIENVLDRIIDYRGKTPTKTDSGVPLITAKNVRMGFIDDEPAEFIGEHNFASWMTRGIPAKGDVLFTTEAPLGNVAQIMTDGRIAFAQRIIILQANKRLHKAFLKYLLMADSQQRWLRTKGTGSTVEGIKQSVFRRLPVAFPKQVEEQTIIVMRLDSLVRQSEIEQEAHRKFQLHKTGLMQDLLTGKVRVKVDEGEYSHV